MRKRFSILIVLGVLVGAMVAVLPAAAVTPYDTVFTAVTDAIGILQTASLAAAATVIAGALVLGFSLWGIRYLKRAFKSMAK